MSAAKRKNNLETLFETIKELNPVDLNIENANNFLSITDMNIETAIKIFSGINKDTSFSKKNVSIVEIKNKIDNFVETFKDYGLTHKAFIKSLNKKPSVLNKPATETKENVVNVVKKFKDIGLTNKSYVAAAARQPQLFYIKPDAIYNNVQGVCEKFEDSNLSQKKYLNMALNAPTLLGYKPEVLANRMKEIKRMYAEGLFKDEGTFIEVLSQRPIALSFGDENLKQRENLAKLTIQNQEDPIRFTTLFRYSKTQVEEQTKAAKAKNTLKIAQAKKKAEFSK
ncbi:MAG: hypothetical protein R3Y43_05545 [Alphaproteobacteria bacterium]